MKRLRKKPRRGTTATEVIVTAILLLGMIGLIVPTTVRVGRVWRQTRNHQIALHELSNQLEYLSGLDPADREAAIAGLRVSDQALASLPEAQLESKTLNGDDGLRIILSLTWEREPHATPLTLVGWLPSVTRGDAHGAADDSSGEEVSHEEA